MKQYLFSYEQDDEQKTHTIEAENLADAEDAMRKICRRFRLMSVAKL